MVAAIGPESAWQDFVIGGLCKTDRLEPRAGPCRWRSAEARRRGSAPGFAAASVWRAWIALRAGAAAGAEADARAADAARASRRCGSTRSRVGLVRCCGARPARRGAARRWRRRAAPTRRHPTRGLDAALPRGRCCAPHGRRRAARSPISSRRAGRRDGPTPDPDFDGWLRIALLRHATGDTAAAAQEAEPALAWARVWGTPGLHRPGADHLGTRHRTRRRPRAAARRCRASRALACPPRARPRAGRARRRAAPPGRAGRRPRAAAARARPRRGRWSGGDRRTSARGAAGHGRQGPATGVDGARLAHAERAPDRRPRSRRSDQPGDRASALRDRQDGRDAPRQRLPQARDHLAPGPRIPGATRQVLGSGYRGPPRSGPQGPSPTISATSNPSTEVHTCSLA